MPGLSGANQGERQRRQGNRFCNFAQTPHRLSIRSSGDSLAIGFEDTAQAWNSMNTEIQQHECRCRQTDECGVKHE